MVRACPKIAGRWNGRDLVPGLVDDKRYHAERNRGEPKRIDSVLGLYDCINCDLCISACPNDAIFAYEAAPVETATEILSEGLGRAPGAGFAIREAHQLAVVEEAGNECSNGTLHARLGGVEMVLAPEVGKNRATVTGDGFRLELAWDPLAVVGGYFTGGETLDTAALWRMKTVWESILDGPAPSMVRPAPRPIGDLAPDR